jgi:hypothetical protein
MVEALMEVVAVRKSRTVVGGPVCAMALAASSVATIARRRATTSLSSPADISRPARVCRTEARSARSSANEIGVHVPIMTLSVGGRSPLRKPLITRTVGSA